MYNEGKRIRKKQIALNSKHEISFEMFCRAGTYVFPYFSKINNKMITRTISVKSYPVRMEIESSISNQLNVTLSSKTEITKEIEDSIIRWIEFVFDLRNSYKKPIANLQDLAEKLGFSPPKSIPFIAVHSPDEMLLNAVLSQNTTGIFYVTMTQLIAKKFGQKLTLDNDISYVYPSIKGNLEIQSIEELSTCKIGYRTKFIPHLASFLIKAPKTFENIPNEELLKELKGIKGIGDYSARSFLIYHLKRFDIVFLDSWVKSTFHSIFNLRKSISIRKFEEFCKKNLSPDPALQLVYILTCNE
jgi:3-methyladenine DNA glycosylase/8-oxoguanine DNA glycosylase